MRKYINQLRDNEQVDEVYLFTDKQLRPNKNGKFYLQFSLSDKTGKIDGRFWNVTDDLFYQYDNNDYVRAEGATQRYQGAVQFIAKKLTKVAAATISEKEFVRVQAIDIPKLRNRLLELLRSLSNPDLVNLADCFLVDEDFMTQFCKSPAGIKLHHAYTGGLLEHSVAMMEIAAFLASLYPVLDRDLLVMGAFLHDVGKTRELSCNGEMFYTDSGQMLGHAMLGVEILFEKIHETEKLIGGTFDQKTAMLLKHLLISHHGTYENQCAKLPMTLEAQTLHFIDSTDSKLAEYQKYMLDDPNIGHPWTNYIPGIDRKLFKTR